MKSVYNLMEGYFHDDRSLAKRPLVESKELPVRARQNQWRYEKSPERLVGSFTFKNTDSYAYFMTSIAEYEKKKNHHAEIVCSYPSIKLTVRTHDLQRVTNQDIRYTKEVLKIYSDALVLERTGNE